MVRKNTLKNINLNVFVTTLSLCVLLSFAVFNRAFAVVNCSTNGNFETCTDSTTFNVGINEVLTVSITRPNSWANGLINTMLTNKIGFSVISNNPAGFTATMKTATATPNLVNIADSSAIIPTLQDSVTLADENDSTGLFPANRWGYGVVDGGDDAPVEYSAMVGSGDTIQITRTLTAQNKISRDIYFAAKTDGNILSGTYANNVVISVVSGVINEDNPDSPIVPGDDIADDGEHTDVERNGNSYSVATTTTTDGETTTTTTETSYANPAGVTTATMVDINEGTPLAISLAVIAGVAAVAGTVLFIIAKRTREEENEDSDY